MGSSATGMNTILISGAGGDVGLAAIQIIREYQPDTRIVGVDIDSENAAPFLCDEFIKATPAGSNEYPDFLDAMYSRFSPDVFIPTSDSEIIRLCRDTSARFPNMLLPNFMAVHEFKDKLTTFEYLRNIGLPVPWTVPLEEFNGSDEPVVVKPKMGRGSQRVYKMSGLADLPKDLVQSDFVVQERLLPADAEVTAAVYRTRQGDIRVLLLRRKLVGGSTSWCEVITNSEAASQISRIAEDLDLWGPLNVQLILTKAGPRIFEINARLSSTLLIRHQMGFTDLVWWLKEGINEDVDHWTRPVAGTIGVKVPTSIISIP